MAWISVHEQVTGYKLRCLAKEIGCSQNEALGMLVRMWLWGVNNATKEGWIPGGDKTDIAQILSVGIADELSADAVVDAMIRVGWIDDTGSGIYIHDWETWQKQWYQAMKIREGNRLRKQKERAGRNASNDQYNSSGEKSAEAPSEATAVSQINDPDPLPTPKLASPGKRRSIDFPNEFEAFWAVYPRQKEKSTAYKHFKARLADGWSADELIQAAAKYAEECKRLRTEPTYIKQAKTFLSTSTPFVDYLKKPSGSVSEVTPESPDDNPFGEWR